MPRATQRKPQKQPSTSSVSLSTLRLLGGLPCLEFVNTIDPRHGSASRDYLGSYADLVAWSHYAGQLSAPERDRLLRTARHRPSDAARTFAQAIALREALYRLFCALARVTAPSLADLAVVQSAYAEAIRRAALVKTPAEFVWTWPAADGTPEEALDHVLWPIAASAIALLTSESVSRVKECAVRDGGCGWLFLDKSKNGSRRWCRMEGCGSRAKMRRQYARKRRSRYTGTPSAMQEAEWEGAKHGIGGPEVTQSDQLVDRDARDG